VTQFFQSGLAGRNKPHPPLGTPYLASCAFLWLYLLNLNFKNLKKLNWTKARLRILALGRRVMSISLRLAFKMVPALIITFVPVCPFISTPLRPIQFSKSGG